MSSVDATPVPYLADEIIDRRYRILEPIAIGGMGTVFLGEHVLIKRRFAIKFLHHELVADAPPITCPTSSTSTSTARR